MHCELCLLHSVKNKQKKHVSFKNQKEKINTRISKKKKRNQKSWENIEKNSSHFHTLLNLLKNNNNARVQL